MRLMRAVESPARTAVGRAVAPLRKRHPAAAAQPDGPPAVPAAAAPPPPRRGWRRAAAVARLARGAAARRARVDHGGRAACGRRYWRLVCAAVLGPCGPRRLCPRATPRIGPECSDARGEPLVW